MSYSKQSFNVDDKKVKELKLKQKVRVIDGSSLTSIDDNGLYDIYIVNHYPKLTGLYGELRNLDAYVVETNIKNHICSGVCGFGYLQDVLIKIGSGLFRCNSTHLEII